MGVVPIHGAAAIAWGRDTRTKRENNRGIFKFYFVELQVK
jgi:hypothetical protein